MQEDKPAAEYTPPSKTQRKAAMNALQALGERMTELPAERLAKLDIPETLREAVRQAQKMAHNEARRRQIQYVGRLMRDVDPAPIEAAIAILDGVSATENARLHRLERLRTRLLEDEAVLGEIVAAHPDVDIQNLRQLRRNTLREREQNRPPKSYRALFQLLKELEANASEESPK